MTQRYIVRLQNDPSDPDKPYCIDDTRNGPNVAPIYEEMSEIEAKTVAEILNEGIGPDWDAVTKDSRWLAIQ